MSLKWARRCERCCCVCVTYFPLGFVYFLTTWAVWVEASIGSQPSKHGWIGSGTSLLGIFLYLLLNWCYTAAVFTNPGITKNRNGYSSLPSHVETTVTIFTVKANGEMRYCKKCQARKPDRAHHCSTCKTCVLKMDHHCPWLATCVGLRNYKIFLLFLVYTTLFCFTCFWVSGYWIWKELLHAENYNESFLPMNCVMLTVISGIIGLLLAGFTCWHIILATRGQTTIECLEKTRFSSPFRKSTHLSSLGPISHTQQINEPRLNSTVNFEQNLGTATFNVHPGNRASYNEHERAQSQRRYNEYLDEQDSKKLPGAFDFGWRKNWLDLFGSNKLLWPFPIVTTVGDGWNWEPSPSWLEARERISRQREEQKQRENEAGWGREASTDPPVRSQGAARHYAQSLSNSPSESHQLFNRPVSKAGRILGQKDEYLNGVLLDTLPPKKPNDNYKTNPHTDENWTHGMDRRVSELSPKSIGGTSILLGRNFAHMNDKPQHWSDIDDGVD